MSARHAFSTLDDAANSNGAAGSRPMILFLAKDLVPAQMIALPMETAPRESAGGSWLRLAKRVARAMAMWRDRARGRRALASLDARLRRDIGITEIEVWREANKPFWHD